MSIVIFGIFQFYRLITIRNIVVYEVIELEG